MSFCLVTDGRIVRQTESDAYEPIVHCALMGSKTGVSFCICTTVYSRIASDVLNIFVPRHANLMINASLTLQSSFNISAKTYSTNYKQNILNKKPLMTSLSIRKI